MLKRMTKLTLCLALALVMLVATAVAAETLIVATPEIPHYTLPGEGSDIGTLTIFENEVTHAALSNVFGTLKESVAASAKESIGASIQSSTIRRLINTAIDEAVKNNTLTFAPISIKNNITNRTDVLTPTDDTARYVFDDDTRYSISVKWEFSYTLPSYLGGKTYAFSDTIDFNFISQVYDKVEVEVYGAEYASTDSKIAINGVESAVVYIDHTGSSSAVITAPAPTAGNIATVSFGSDNEIFTTGISYEINPLEGDAKVTINYNTPNASDVLMTKVTGVTTEINEKIAYGAEKTFDIVPENNYRITNVAVDKANGVTISDPNNGIYTVKIENNSVDPVTFTITASAKKIFSFTKVNFVEGFSKDQILENVKAAANADLPNDVAVNKVECDDSFNNKKVGDLINVKLYLNNGAYPSMVARTVELADLRTATQVQVNEGVSFTYDAERTAEDVLKELFAGVTANGENITTTDAQISAEIPSLNAGTHTATISYSGNISYAPSSATVSYTITKANATISVLNQEVEYNKRGSLKEPVSISPSDASFFSFCAGLDMTSGAYIQLNMPQMIDQDALDSLLGNLPDGIKKIIQNAINDAMNGLGGDIPLNKLASTLNDALKTIEKLENDYNIDLPLGFDKNAISTLTSVLNEVVKVMPEGMDVVVKLSFGGSIIPKNAGVYLVGGVASDPNYNTTFSTNNLGYLVIRPSTVEKTLAFNQPDENNLFTLGSIATRDLGSKVVDDAALTSSVQNLFIGVDIDGNTVLKLTDADAKNTAEVRKAGSYAQIAFLLDLGNEINYAKPIIRQITVVPDLVDVRFIDENGNVNNERIFTYDGKPHGMTAKVYNRSGALLPDADQNRVTYTYAGIEGDGEGYLSASAPRKAGVYAVTATYANADKTVYGAAVGTMIIKPSNEADITVTNRTELQGTNVAVNSMVSSSPADAAKTVITSAVNVSGDFSKQGLDALSGVINVDFPARIDNLLDKAGVNRNNPLSVYGLKNALSKLLGKTNAQLDIAQLNDVIELLNQLPVNANLTFNDNVSYDDIGVYMVIGAITDPDYTLKTSYGLLVITPSVTTYELRWNYNDVNGIITYPMLSTPSLFNASAYVTGASEVDAKLTSKIRYLFIGLNASGNLVTYTNAAQINQNGVHFQLAYVYDEISKDIAIAKPISRIFAVAPQNVDIRVNPVVITVGEEYNMLNNVRVTKRDGGEPRMDALSLYYMGADVDGNAYYSSEQPKAEGQYSVVALYVEMNGRTRAALTSLSDVDLTKVQYAGVGMGSITILPAGSDLPPDDPTDPDDPTGGNTPDVDDSLNDLPQTGDDSSLMLWLALLCVCMGSVVILIKRKINA